MRFYYFFCLACITYGIYLFAYHLFIGDLFFHTDIARDFLLIQDIAVNHKLTLLGSRAGGIPGLFFGPVWYYINVPAFIIGNGNPLIIGYYWLLLTLFGLGSIFYISKKIFNPFVGIVATTIFLYTIIFLATGFTSSFAQIILSPMLLYSIYLFIEKKHVKYLGWAAFLSGFIIQFQPAFGSIMLFITFVLSLVILVRRKQIKYQLIWFLALVPLSTYIVFDLRHNFLETRSLYAFIFHHNASTFNQVTPELVVANRWQGFLNSLNLVGINNPLVNTFFILLNVGIAYLWAVSKKSGQRTAVLLIYLYVLCFWLITFLFKGTVWNYYYWGLYPLLSIALGSLVLKLDRRVFGIFFAVFMLFMIKHNNFIVHAWQTTFSGKDTSSWIVNEEVAKYVYNDAQQDFGYYVYSTDNFGYSKKYAMSYFGRTGVYKEKGYLCTKKPITYLIYEQTSPGTHTDPVFWKTASVSIKTKPIAVKTISTIKIEKYQLTPKQVKNPSDPTMICGLQWR